MAVLQPGTFFGYVVDVVLGIHLFCYWVCWLGVVRLQVGRRGVLEIRGAELDEAHLTAYLCALELLQILA